MIKSFLSNKNPDELYQSMMKSNPQFQKFIRDTEGKTIEDIALEYDIDMDLIKRFM